MGNEHKVAQEYREKVKKCEYYYYKKQGNSKK